MSFNYDSKDSLDFLEFDGLKAERGGVILGQNIKDFFSKRDLLRNNFKDTTIFNEVTQDPSGRFWDDHFRGVALSSKSGVFRAALNLPEYNLISCNHCRQPSRINFIHNCSENVLYLKSQTETFQNMHLQPIGRNQRVTCLL